MELHNLTTIADELRKQRDLAHKKATSLGTELGSVEEEIARIDAALAALSGNAFKPSGNGTKTKEFKRTTHGRSAKKADVIAAMSRLLEKEEVMAADALKKQVEALLTEDGFNRFGFAMRWKEAIQDPQFVATAEGLKLSSSATSNGTPQRRDFTARNSGNRTQAEALEA